ncbi:MAG: hypothetical protein IPH62_17990 [Ignavibacteriae bacterium]|nr:hypothetical protein [Ignavibacteriota bacterium]
MIKTPKIIIATIILFILVENIFSQKNIQTEFQSISNINSFVPKEAGVAFRIDDNYAHEYYTQMAEIFDDYNETYGRSYHFSFALNFAASYNYNSTAIPFSSPSYISAIKTIQDAGHEIMDHTPNHRTNYFITEFPASEYLEIDLLTPIAGVDHIIEQANGKRKICLEFNSVDISELTPIGTCNVLNDTIYGNFTAIDYDTEIYVYLEGYGLYFIYNFFKSKTKAQILDFWENPVSLPQANNVNFYKFDRKNKLSIDAIRVLANETLKLAELFDIDRPTTWIQPGGRHPVISTLELSTALKPLGYKAGASFGDSPKSFKIFNEYDPNEYLEFGMQWEDFNEDKTTQTLETIKTTISDGIAKNKVMIGHNHFYDLKGNNGYVLPTEYFQRVEEILAWCHQNNIEINTYAEWADILYEKTSDPYDNVFPPLNVNLDTYTNTLNPDGIPDGYEPRTTWIKDGNIIDDKGVWEIDATAPEGYCYTKYYDNWARIFLVQNLGGVEKGENEFEIWTKGGQSDGIKIVFSFPNTSYQNEEFIIPANTENWQKYNLLNSTNDNTDLIIPSDVSLVNVEVLARFQTGPISVSGMSLSKKIPTISTNLKIFLEGAYSSANSMPIDPTFQSVIQTSQPFSSSPWNYNGTENVLSIPIGVVDWVLVELRETTEANSIKARKAGFVKTDGTIVGLDGITNLSFDIPESNYYVVIYHRNHLPIMSSVPVSFN